MPSLEEIAQAFARWHESHERINKGTPDGTSGLALAMGAGFTAEK